MSWTLRPKDECWWETGGAPPRSTLCCGRRRKDPERASGWATFKQQWELNKGLSEWLGSPLLFHSNFPNIWEQREAECNSSSALARRLAGTFSLVYCFAGVGRVCARAKKAFWGVSCRLGARPSFLRGLNLGREGNALLQHVWERSFRACCSFTPQAEGGPGKAARGPSIKRIRSRISLALWWSADVVTARFAEGAEAKLGCVQRV